MNYDARNEKFAPRIRKTTALTMPAFVLASDQRPSLIVPHLADQNYTVSIPVPDFELPPDAPLMLQPYLKCSPLLSNYRIFRSHQRAAQKFLVTGAPVGLFFEDDAVPVSHDWQSITNLAASMMGTERAEVFYLYGREFEAHRFETQATIFKKYEIKSLRPGQEQPPEAFGGVVKVFGSLAYLLNRLSAHQFVRTDWSGIPVDICLADLCRFRFLSPSPFVHNRSQGSLNYPSFGANLANDPGK